MVIHCSNEQQTKAFATKFANVFVESPFNNLYLDGELGTGKTTFVRYFLEALHIDDVRSPSYTLINIYPHRQENIHHSDMYRIESIEDLIEETSIEQTLESKEIFIVEWASKFSQFFHTFPHCSIKIESQNETERIFTLHFEPDCNSKLFDCLNQPSY